MTRLTGRVIRIVREKGFGFIRVDGGKAEYFFHRSACPIGVFETLVDDDAVSFTPAEGAKGPRAESVELLG